MQTVLKAHELDRAIQLLADAPSTVAPSRAFFGSTTGGHPAQCESHSFWSLVWSGNALHWLLGPLALLGGRRAIVQFSEARGIPAFVALSEQLHDPLLIEFYGCSANTGGRIREEFAARGRRANLEALVRNDESFFTWSHSAEDDWCYVQAEHGHSCPKDLRERLADIGGW